MKFNSGTDSLYADALFWSGATTTTFPIDPDFTRSTNAALDIITAIIQEADDAWDYTDSNDSTELIDATTNLVSGTAKYAVAASWLKVARVRVKDANGNWITLRNVQRAQLSDSQLAESGTPWGYYMLGGYLYLVGTPNYSQSAGIEIQFQRGADHFVVADTTAEPGFAPQFHRLVSLMAALDYCEANNMERKARTIRVRIGEVPAGLSRGTGLLKQLVEFYGNRDRDGATSLSLQSEDYGAASLAEDFNPPRGFNI